MDLGDYPVSSAFRAARRIGDLRCLKCGGPRDRSAGFAELKSSGVRAFIHLLCANDDVGGWILALNEALRRAIDAKESKP